MYACTRASAHACMSISWGKDVPKYPTASALIIQCLRACVRAYSRVRVFVRGSSVPVRVRAYVRPSLIIVEIGQMSPGVFLGKRGTPGRGLGVVLLNSQLIMVMRLWNVLPT